MHRSRPSSQSGPLGTTKALRIAKQIALGLARFTARRGSPSHPSGQHRGQHRRLDGEDRRLCERFPACIRRRAVPALDERAIPLAYISPEQTGASHRKVDHRSDFYSLGRDLYHLLVGHPPFEHLGPARTRHTPTSHSRRVHSRNSMRRIPEHVERLVDKLLAKSPRTATRVRAASSPTSSGACGA